MMTDDDDDDVVVVLLMVMVTDVVDVMMILLLADRTYTRARCAQFIIQSTYALLHAERTVIQNKGKLVKIIC